MKVRAIRRQRSECAERIRPYVPWDGADVSIGEEYEVHAICVFNGFVDLQIIGDDRRPQWYPYALFEVSDPQPADDWVFRLFPNSPLNELSMIIGPEFIAASQERYAAMVELDADQVDRFWKRIESLKSRDVGP